ncbi:uncharacterized protein ARMOST_13285 [Armillaria ostoyae]|uniref:Uncharacterized protein n=1 Tax=Armillaria ostoyae TaxID=47428 RepID=A0A284RMF0_ARMOS|nr:uncharacterized protein ARMOST_13285 [Armillaria ostoyae]
MPTLLDSCHSGKSLDHHWDPSLQFVQNKYNIRRDPRVYKESIDILVQRVGLLCWYCASRERAWKYVLVSGAGHLVPTDAPNAVFVLARDFIFGNNETGLVDGDRVVGGEDSTLAIDILPGGDEIYYGAGATQSTYVFPSATRSAWEAFIQTATAAAGVTLTSQNDGHSIQQLGSTSRFGWAMSILLSYVG